MVTILIVVGLIVVSIAGSELVLWVRGMVRRIEDLERLMDLLATPDSWPGG